MKLVSYTDASYKSAEDGARSVGGRIVILANSTGKVSPLGQFSKSARASGVLKHEASTWELKTAFSLLECLLRYVLAPLEVKETLIKFQLK